MKDVGDGVLVVGEILVIGAPNVAVDVFQLHEQERRTVDETDDIRPAAIKRPLDPEFAYGEEVVVPCIAEIEHAQSPGFHTAARVSVGDLHAVAQKVVFFAVGLEGRMGCAHLHDDTYGVFVGFGWKAGVELFERLTQVAYEHDILVARPPQCPVGPEGLGVIGIDRFPAELLLQVFGGGLLDESVFGIG